MRAIFDLYLEREGLLSGERHLNHHAAQFTTHYHLECPHQGHDRNNEPLVAYKFPDSAEGKVVCRQRGLIKHDTRKAA